MFNFKAYLTEEIQPGQAIMAHEPNDKQSLSVNNPVLVAKINSVFTIELSDIFLSPESGFQKVRKVLHRFGLDMPPMYGMDPDGDEIVLDVTQYGDASLGSGLLYILYSLNDEGYYDFYAEINDETGIEELLASGIEGEDEEE
jgi:hypothetical protein